MAVVGGSLLFGCGAVVGDVVFGGVSAVSFASWLCHEVGDGGRC
jgi:hypothetical protein